MNKFDGSDYEHEHDYVRLSGQIQRVYDAIKDGDWYTLDQINRITGDPHASVSAQLRNLRKQRFGSHVVEKRYRGNRASGLWEYSLEI